LINSKNDGNLVWMKKMARILFIGNFLSNKKGSVNPSERMVSLLGEHQIISASYYNNKILRVFDIIQNILSRKYDFAHIDVFSGQAFRIAEISSFFLKLFNKPYLLTLHGGYLDGFYEKNPRRIQKLFSNATKITSPSLYLIDSFKKYPVEHIPNFIDLDKFTYSKRKNNSKKLLWVRAFSKIYNPEIPVGIMRILNRKYPELTLTMVGPDKGEKKRIMKLIKKYGLQNKICLKGQISNEKLSQMYHSHDIYLNTTSYESFGLSVLEAAACGIPIISTKVGELPFLWEEDKEVILVDKVDSKEFAVAIEELIKNENKIKVLRKNARKKAERYDWKKIKPKWISLFEEMLKS